MNNPNQANQPSPEWLHEQIKNLGPWHHDIQLTDEVSTGRVFSDDGILDRPENDGVSLISPRELFRKKVLQIYPDGLADKRFLDCACNAGVYCFLAREMDAAHSVGFDVRDHWIKQAKFAQQHRTVTATDRIDFSVLDVYDLGKQGLQRFDLTLFSGIFYHLPDPIHGLKLAADLTSDVIIVNTASLDDDDNPKGLTMHRRRPQNLDKNVMSGVYEIAWFPNGPQAIAEILCWLGFTEMKLVRRVKKEGVRGRFEIVAARTKDRLANVEGEYLTLREDM